jgi:hypothetical protein
LDDGFVIFAWLLALLTAVDWQVVADFLFHFIDVTRGRLWPPPAIFVNDSERYYKGSVVVIVMFYTGLWAVKFSFLLFFKRLGQNVAGQKVLWWCVLGFTVVTYLLCIGDIQYSCLAAPFAKIEIRCSTDSAVQYQRVTLAINCAVDVVTDYLSVSFLCKPSKHFLSNVDNYGDSHQHAMGGANVGPKESGFDRHLFAHSNHYAVCHCSSHGYQLFNSSA